MEVQAIYGDDIRVWAENSIRQTDRSLLIQALAAGDCEAAETFISTQLHDTICRFYLSYYREFLADLLKKAITRSCLRTMGISQSSNMLSASSKRTAWYANRSNRKFMREKGRNYKKKKYPPEKIKKT